MPAFGSCVLVSRQTSTRIDQWKWAQCQLLTEYTKPKTAQAALLRNCRVSQSLRPFLSLFSACVTVMGFPHGSSPSSEVTCAFFSCVFGRTTELKLHVPYRPFRNVVSGTVTTESWPSHDTSHFFSGRETCGVQRADGFTVIQFVPVFTGGLLMKHSSDTI